MSSQPILVYSSYIAQRVLEALGGVPGENFSSLFWTVETLPGFMTFFFFFTKSFFLVVTEWVHGRRDRPVSGRRQFSPSEVSAAFSTQLRGMYSLSWAYPKWTIYSRTALVSGRFPAFGEHFSE